jgi:hypothetical protein
VNGFWGWAPEDASNGLASRGWGGSKGFCWRAVGQLLANERDLAYTC